MDKKVYCSDCYWFKGVFSWPLSMPPMPFLGGRRDCAHPLNLKEKHTPRKRKIQLIIEYDVRNRENDCHWFENRGLKSAVKRFIRNFNNKGEK